MSESLVCSHCNGLGRLRSGQKCFLCGGDGYIKSVIPDKKETMNPQDTVYIPVPVSEKPEKEGFYFTLEKDRTGNNWFRNGKWLDEIMSSKPTHITHWLKPTTIAEITNQNQPASVTVDDLCRQLEEQCKKNFGFSYIGETSLSRPIGFVINTVRELLTGKIITTPQAISDVWDAAIAWYEGELERGTPLPDKSIYLKEKFNTTSQPVKTNDDI